MISSNNSGSTFKANVDPDVADVKIPNILSSTTNNDNAIILSLYLIQSDQDILHKTTNNSYKRSNLYKRLCAACQIANETLRSASSSTTPFQAGGDGPIFGVYCNVVSNDELLSRNDFDADELWQSQSITDEQSTDNDIDDEEKADKQNNSTLESDVDTFQQPHLRAIFRYGNDVNDMWRCISLMMQITTDLTNVNLRSSVECWDVNDGHILLIEAAEHLPSWVDDDVMQGGVGGPEGTYNRCWIVDGKVHLIPPTSRNNRDTSSMKNKKVDLLSRREALNELVDSFHNDPDGASTVASKSVQYAIHHRINRTDYSARDSIGNTSNSHWHVAAAALPASVAYFIQKHPPLVPLIIDSFCENAPKYLKQQKRKRKNAPDETSKGIEQAPSMQQTGNNQYDALGSLFPFEQIVVIPITITRANFAELSQGRGIVPAFPVPREYRSVELKRFHRQLGQFAFGGLDDDSKRRNPFDRAVDVGVRLCAGLEWIVACSKQVDDEAILDSKEDKDLELQSLGDVERRLRLFWTRVDAEASVDIFRHDFEGDETNHWIETAWQAGPMNSNHIHCDKIFLSALESMSKCPVFNPELSKSLQDEPCPITKPQISLREMTQTGIKNALKWQREEYDESHFPMPKLCQLDSDAWMEIESMEALEEEMKNLSSATTKADVPSEAETKPRRTTRRSRRNLNTNSGDEQGGETTNSDTLNKMATGFRAFVEGQDVDGISDATPENDSIESFMSQEVIIKPRVFFGALQSLLRDRNNLSSLSSTEVKSEALPSEPVEPDISSFFFEEDFNNYDSGDDSDVDVKAHIDLMQESQINPDDDPFSLKNIMQAMDHELRTDVLSDPSIKNLSVAMEDDLDDEAMANLLRSIEASEGAGPARNMLLGMGIALPRPETD
eukprot:scaffold21543_cov145-Skeletonema_menzelii.AAC.6